MVDGPSLDEARDAEGRCRDVPLEEDHRNVDLEDVAARRHDVPLEVDAGHPPDIHPDEAARCRVNLLGEGYPDEALAAARADRPRGEPTEGDLRVPENAEEGPRARRASFLGASSGRRRRCSLAGRSRGSIATVRRAQRHYQFSGGDFPQEFDLVTRQAPAFPHAQSLETDRADGDPSQRHDFVAELREHPADLAVLPFGEDHLQDRGLPATCRRSERAWRAPSLRRARRPRSTAARPRGRGSPATTTR